MTTSTASGTDASEQLVARVQQLQDALEAAPDSATRDLAEELISSIVQLYGEGLERIIARLNTSGEAGARLAAGLTDDPLLCTLLLIHDLHPVPLADRVRAALDSVRPYMESHGGNVELLSLDDGVARIHLQGSCSDCSASSVTLELAIKQALEDHAPDLAGLEVEGAGPQSVTGVSLPMASDPPTTGMELPVVMSAGPPAAPAWFELTSLEDLTPGALAAVAVEGRPLVIANIDGTLLAYEDRCAGCGGPLHGGTLAAGSLTCPACDRAFFLPRAGRSRDDETLQLAPVPLLRERGSVKVALAI
jgi:Fe-S cluster biogenesis protein NfuA/nitrite reductase/ring-hydroxylating ferredoxin subunit